MTDRSTQENHNAKILGCTPSFKITSVADAKNHYVKRLGFTLDWEWQDSDTMETVMQISRDVLKLFLQSAKETRPGERLSVYVSELEPLVEEWNAGYDSKFNMIIEPPYDLPTAYITDPSGNILAIQQAQTSEQLEDQRSTVDKIIAILKERASREESIPAASVIMAEFEVSAGVANECLSRYEQST